MIFIGGFGVEIGIFLTVLFGLALIFWLIRRPVNQRIDELEENYEERLNGLEERIEELE